MAILIKHDSKRTTAIVKLITKNKREFKRESSPKFQQQSHQQEKTKM